MPACSNYTGKVGIFGKTVQLHKLPTNHSLRRSWIMAISRKNWSPTNYTRVCSDHFVDGIEPVRKHNDKIPTENMAQKQPGKEEVEMTKRIASARIHVERKMEQIKNFRILHYKE